ncbi:hypothetical protein BASA83_006841 [Batrachochytrium salamandrivorans]|nr:hypothetical protein BASA83_006841 [Batrachochytrium salamandrivorans]
MPQPPQHIPPSSTLSMDLPFSLRELDHALGSMHPRKAPGDDGITTALMQAIAHDPKIMARLSSLLESNNVLVPEQGGFRTREESTAQVCALMDILRRRQIADLNSHIAFIDISKAFDTVPIHALLFKLRCIGIPTITMNFCLPCIPLPMHALDLDLSCRTLFQCSAMLDKDVPSQGSYSMSLSNGVLDGVAPISVPGLSQEHHPRGLMFADDIAIIAPSHESLCTSMGTMADWATRWEMSFGVTKCGIMHVAPIPEPLSRLRFCQLNNPLETAAAETADQTPTTPSSHPFLQYPHQVLSLSIQISLVLQITTLPHPYPPAAVFIFHHHPFPNQLYSLPQQHPPKPNSPNPSNSMVSIYHLYPRVAYYGLKLIRGNSTLARRLQAPVNTGIRMILKAPLFTPIAPMLTDCGSLVWTRMPYCPRPAYSQTTTFKTPLRTLLLPSTIPSHSNSWFWTRRSRSLIRFVHPNMSLFHFNIPISTNGLFHNPISTNPPITNPDINPSIQNTPFINTSITLHSLLSPLPPTISEIRHQRSKYAFERTFQVWGKSKLACSYVQANRASSVKFLRSPALSTGQAIGASLLSLARLWWPMGLP